MTTDLQATPHPIHPDATDMLLMVGDDQYTVPAFIREAQEYGVSKRIPSTSIPHGIVPGVSRLFLWHRKVIPLIRAEGKTLFDLTTRLIDMEKLDRDTALVLELNEQWKPTDLLLPDSYVPPAILRITCIIQDLKPAERRKIEEDFEIEWQGAVFMFTYLGQVQVVVPEHAGEDDIPEKFKTIADEVDFVKVDYED